MPSSLSVSALGLALGSAARASRMRTFIFLVASFCTDSRFLAWGAPVFTLLFCLHSLFDVLAGFADSVPSCASGLGEQRWRLGTEVRGLRESHVKLAIDLVL
jgi:hypothetical protein